jgi:DNA-directed RNA polymerase II subunit RPB7
MLIQAQLIPDDIRFDQNATPPQWTDSEDQIIQVGSHVRVKIIGSRAEVGSIYAIASIKEDYLGFVLAQDNLQVKTLIRNSCLQPNH